MRKRLRALIRQGVAGATALGMVAMQAGVAGANRPDFPVSPQTATPIKHLVVIFGENISFDHYFGTYPNATNPPGEPSFSPLRGRRASTASEESYRPRIRTFSTPRTGPARPILFASTAPKP